LRRRPLLPSLPRQQPRLQNPLRRLLRRRSLLPHRPRQPLLLPNLLRPV
jgi:hypothetical protein